ncbi:MAG: polysaccharide pyruvyl transferase family protein [Oscillospiraceae bacterium]|jgi:polysaccharide pyruvyl transferase WcaK-like protein|nr:polysaccharide pyruvyl transferase family protein [Oscillospiraceae bacterium]
MRIALYFHQGGLNRGSEAIVQSTLPLLEEAFRGAAVSLYTTNPEEDQSMRLPGYVTIKPLFPKTAPPIGKISLARAKLFLYRHESQKKADEFFFGRLFARSDFFDHDLFLSVGGDCYCYGDVSEIAALNRGLVKRGKPAVLWGCSIDEDALTPQKHADLRRYSMILARESRTLALLQGIGLGERSFLHPDPAFLLEAQETPLPEGFIPGKTIGLNLSSFLLPDAAGERMEALYALVRLLLRDQDAIVALIPHVMRTYQDDRKTMQPLLDEFRNEPRVIPLAFAGAPWSASQLKFAISQCKALIAARTHACIAAYSTGVPVLALGYSGKAGAIATDLFGTAQGLVLSAQDMTVKGLCGSAEVFLARLPELREHLTAHMPEIRANARGAGARLKAFCGE